MADTLEVDQPRSRDRGAESPAVGEREQRIDRAVQHERREAFEVAQPTLRARLDVKEEVVGEARGHVPGPVENVAGDGAHPRFVERVRPRVGAVAFDDVADDGVAIRPIWLGTLGGECRLELARRAWQRRHRS